MTRRALVPLMVAVVVGATSAGAAAESMSLVEVRHLNAGLVQNWLTGLLEDGSLGIEADSVKRIGVVIRDNSVLLEGEAAAVEAIKAAIAAADGRLSQVQISMTVLEMADATPLLGTATPERTVVLADGTEVAAPELRSRPASDSGVEDPRRTTVVNTLVDEALISELIDSGQAMVINNPRLTTVEGAPGTASFATHIEATDDGDRYFGTNYTLTAATGEGDIVTVEAHLRSDEPQGPTERVGPLRYTTRLGQAVAVAALGDADERSLVYIITVTAVE